ALEAAIGAIPIKPQRLRHSHFCCGSVYVGCPIAFFAVLELIPAPLNRCDPARYSHHCRDSKLNPCELYLHSFLIARSSSLKTFSCVLLSLNPIRLAYGPTSCSISLSSA